jgi:hypothetical protein
MGGTLVVLCYLGRNALWLCVGWLKVLNSVVAVLEFLLNNVYEPYPEGYGSYTLLEIVFN